MGTTFVYIVEEKGFWMSDGVLELWLRLLALHIEDPTEPGTRAGQIRDQWLVASRGFFNGCVPCGLAQAVADSDGRKVVLGAITSLMNALKRGPVELDARTLNLLGIVELSQWGRNFPSAALLEVGQAFLDLIDGKIGASASDTSFMPGNSKD